MQLPTAHVRHGDPVGTEARFFASSMYAHLSGQSDQPCVPIGGETLRRSPPRGFNLGDTRDGVDPACHAAGAVSLQERRYSPNRRTSHFAADDPAVREFLTARKAEMQAAVDSLTRRLETETVRRREAEAAVHDLRQHLDREVGREQRSESQNHRLASQVKQLTLQHAEAMEMEARRLEMAEARTQMSWRRNMEEAAALSRSDLLEQHTVFLGALRGLWDAAQKAAHDASLALARSAEAVACQDVQIVDLEHQVRTLTAKLDENERVSADSMTEFLRTIKAEMRENEGLLLRRADEDQLRREEIEAENSSLADDASQARDRLALVEEQLASLRAQHVATKTELARERREQAATRDRHEAHVRSLALHAEENRSLRQRLAASEQASAGVTRGVRSVAQSLQSTLRDRLDEADGVGRWHTQDGSRTGASSAAQRRPGDSGAQLPSEGPLEAAIQHTQDALDTMRLQFATQIERLEAALILRNTEVSELRSLIDTRDDALDRLTATPPHNARRSGSGPASSSSSSPAKPEGCTIDSASETDSCCTSE